MLLCIDFGIDDKLVVEDVFCVLNFEMCVVVFVRIEVIIVCMVGFVMLLVDLILDLSYFVRVGRLFVY